MDWELLEAGVRGYRLRECHLLLLEIASVLEQAETEDINSNRERGKTIEKEDDIFETMLM